MLGAAAREMLDLLTAGDTGGDDLRLRGGGLHRGREPTIAERDRDVVVLALEAERAGHAAAARVDFLDLESRPAKRRDRGRRADERLLVAVPVEQRLAPRGAAVGGVRCPNQSVNVWAARDGSGRRRSIPAILSSAQRLGARFESQLTSAGTREPTAFIREIRPNRRLRSGSPLAL